jgi:hypothetical protein
VKKGFGLLLEFLKAAREIIGFSKVQKKRKIPQKFKVPSSQLKSAGKGKKNCSD